MACNPVEDFSDNFVIGVDICCGDDSECTHGFRLFHDKAVLISILVQF